MRKGTSTFFTIDVPLLLFVVQWTKPPLDLNFAFPVSAFHPLSLY